MDFFQAGVHGAIRVNQGNNYYFPIKSVRKQQYDLRKPTKVLNIMKYFPIIVKHPDLKYNKFQIYSLNIFYNGKRIFKNFYFQPNKTQKVN